MTTLPNVSARLSVSIIIQFFLLVNGIALSPLVYAGLSDNSTLTEKSQGTSSAQESISDTTSPSTEGQAAPSSSTDEQLEVSNDPPPCDSQDPTCNSDNSGPPPCDSQDPTCNSDNSGPPPCDSQDPTCNSDNSGPPPCDSQDPTCDTGPPCDSQDPTCDTGPPCDSQDPTCDTGPPCSIFDPTCTPPPTCDIQDPTCVPPPCDINDITCNEGTPPTPEICDNGGRDDDGDGLADVIDPDCTGSTAPTENQCTDHIDNDHDGKTDRSDSDCGNPGGGSAPRCVDTNNDGIADKSDPGCGGPCPACIPGGALAVSNSEARTRSIATSTTFNSERGFAEAASTSEVSNCQDGRDNDQDGLKDYQDPNCQSVIQGTLIKGNTQISDLENNASTHHIKNNRVVSDPYYFAVSNSPYPTIKLSGAGDLGAEDSTKIPVVNQTMTKLYVVNGSSVTWIMKDSKDLHALVIEGKHTGEIIYSTYKMTSPRIFTSFTFSHTGEFIFYDPYHPSVKGEIIVTPVPKTSSNDQSLTNVNSVYYR